MKLPILNNHKCEGIYKMKLFGKHYCWIPHVILGMLSLIFPFITYFFIGYQVSQMISKRGEIWEDFIDIVEFFAGRVFVGIFKT